MEWLVDRLLSVAYSIFDVFLSFIESICSMGGLQVYSLMSIPMDSVTLWILNNLYIGQCLGIIGGAYLIRFLLNLVPGAITRV